MSKPMTRDPYLPSPEVCDWLLEQEWSKPAVIHIDSPESTGWRDDCCRATAALGRDGVIELLAFAEDLEMLREDQRQRLGEDSNGPDPVVSETDLLMRILAESDESGLTPVQVAGILHAAANATIAQWCGSVFQDDQP